MEPVPLIVCPFFGEVVRSLAGASMADPSRLLLLALPVAGEAHASSRAPATDEGMHGEAERDDDPAGTGPAGLRSGGVYGHEDSQDSGRWLLIPVEPIVALPYGHTSHASHASHSSHQSGAGSHSSHFSGSLPSPSPRPSPPVVRPPAAPAPVAPPPPQLLPWPDARAVGAFEGAVVSTDPAALTLVVRGLDGSLRVFGYGPACWVLSGNTLHAVADYAPTTGAKPVLPVVPGQRVTVHFVPPADPTAATAFPMTILVVDPPEPVVAPAR